MSKNYTKKQHYIPQGVLKNFAYSDKQIYECLVASSSGKIFSASIKNAMCQSNIYEHTFLEKNNIEHFFANSIDNELYGFHQDVISLLSHRLSGDTAVNSVSKRVLETCKSIVISYYRSGAILEEYNTAYEFEKDDEVMEINVAIKRSSYKKLLEVMNPY